MLQLIELRFKNIGRFVDEQIINFDALGSFVQVDGQNNNTGGSSGSGKSTIFQGLDYLLGLGGKPATVLQSRKIINPEEKSLSVQGVFMWDDTHIVITRSKGNFDIRIGDDLIKKDKAEEKLDEILGMPKDLFRKVIHKRQKEGGFFLDLTAGEMHDFLMDCIGLSPFKVKFQIIEKEIAKLTEKLDSLDASIKTDQASLSATQDAILALGMAPIQDIHKEVILELKEKHDRSALRFNDVKSRCEGLDREFAKTRPSTTNMQYDETVRENLEARRKDVEGQIRLCFEEERSRQEKVRERLNQCSLGRSAIVARIDLGTEAKAKATVIAAEIKQIRSQSCPTCNQNWASESSAAVEQRKINEAVTLKAIIVDATKAADELVEIDKQVAGLKFALTPEVDPRLPTLNEELSGITGKILEEKRKANELYEQQTAEVKKQLDDFVLAQNELRSKHSLEIEQARGQMDVDRRVLDIAVQKLRAYEEAKERFEKTCNELKKKEESFTEKVLKCKSEHEATLKCMILALETKKCIKMYVSYSFDEALDAIGDKATKIIRCIPNTSSATIQFEGTKETQAGKVKEEVNAVIGTDGETGIPIKSLSGGERSAVDLAVDLAVIDYIESKTGKGMNIFILDEPFTGLGTVEIEMALEVLKNSNINKKLTIVDHNPEVKQMVQDRLVVIRDGLTSKVA